MATAVLDQHRIAALALDKRSDVGLAKFAFEDQQIAFPVAELGPIINKIRPLRDPALKRDEAVTRLAGSTRQASATSLRQVLVKAKRIILLAIDEAIDRFRADADWADPVSQQPTGNLFR